MTYYDWTNEEWWKYYLDWKKNFSGTMTWADYYFKYLTGQFVRSDRQRNYQRNKDIVYHSKGTKANKRTLKYLVGDVEAPLFTIEDETGLLLYTLDSYCSPTRSGSDLIQIIIPLAYVRIYMNDDLELVADVPTMIFGDIDFTIDEYGILKYNLNEIE